MDRHRRVDLICNLPAKGPASHAGRRAAGSQAVFRGGPEHDRMVCAGDAKDGEGPVIRVSLMMTLMALSGPAAAAMADQAHRSKVDGIDLITYHSNVKDVVVIMGVLPAGDAMAEPGNIAIPTLTGMMLDRGTKELDKFAIADKLENVGADISIGVGAQSVEVRAKCLRKDLPMVMGLIAAELRT